MSLIHTCRLCGANPLDYLNAIVRHAKEATRASDPVVPVELQAGPPGCRNQLRRDYSDRRRYGQPPPAIFHPAANRVFRASARLPKQHRQ